MSSSGVLLYLTLSLLWNVCLCAYSVFVPMFVWRESWTLHSGSLTDKTVGLTHLSKGEGVTQMIFQRNVNIFWEGLMIRTSSIFRVQVPLKYQLRFPPSVMYFPLKHSFRFQSLLTCGLILYLKQIKSYTSCCGVYIKASSELLYMLCLSQNICCSGLAQKFIISVEEK